MAHRKSALTALTLICVLISASATSVFPAAASARAPRDAILPPANPPYSLPILQYLWPSCSGADDYSSACLETSLAMLNAGRLKEQLGPVLLPSNWQQLTIAQQLFVLTELERTARGLPADTGLAADWDAAAQLGADAGQDPTSGGSGARGFQAVWAGGQPNPIVVTADWVYADGVFPDGSSQNLGCSSSTTSGCWSHRDTVLHDSAAAACDSRCAVGAAFSATGFSAGEADRHESYAEIFGSGGGNNADPLDFTWAAEQQQLPSCERTSDSCSWAGIKVVTASGIKTARTGSSQASESTGDSQPSFAVHVSSHVGRSGRVSLLIRTGVRLLGVNVVARLGAHHVTLRARRRSKYVFRATGTLTAGHWTATIRYRQAHGHGLRPMSKLRLTVL
jgi:hypothetical protein